MSFVCKFALLAYLKSSNEASAMKDVGRQLCSSSMCRVHIIQSTLPIPYKVCSGSSTDSVSTQIF